MHCYRVRFHTQSKHSFPPLLMIGGGFSGSYCTHFNRQAIFMNIQHSQRFAGIVAFVTGATSGIGRSTAIVFAQEGAIVVLVDISEQGTQETARVI
ncbi:MAG: SDR family NAD(P)-dependent oxidoreductase [Pseudomonas sp.]|uniref:SDR family NAD(P)-dependent oxidoreductase n=1 Tax=Pseudomonas psychrophila TaxID=122355 RepID=UPI00069FA586|nr:SDR family NAD(P)-dependent oxidoreductase [Pseudomonas psychrophila]MBL1310359.1 SDR family NAD(P)-dependent oxidoreductase [Pseudomonas sp.]MDO1496484.1 SDR family NAD(P)-dependent oxidoreductase [Pseudomonas putida]PMU26002.1 hypothetical protein C1X90_08145 [Pseudomonas sp. GP01-A9]PMU32165.1 hypothetical protein C1X88_02860 [Pseudomonas sp. GP01-A13]PMU39742.1 hypothetical protein C1X89_13495 [Pseudomonas sp. GP01-A8]PMU56218.1 hypothetical protein C1X87_01905 [Pseudomonas sp. GP01-A1